MKKYIAGLMIVLGCLSVGAQTELYNPIVFGELKLGEWKAVTGLAVEAVQVDEYGYNEAAYFYRITGVNSSGRLPYSNPVNIVIAWSPPTNAVKITWNYTSKIDYYVIERSGDGISWTEYVTVAPNKTELMDTQDINWTPGNIAGKNECPPGQIHTTESDPIFGASVASGITSQDVEGWNKTIADIVIVTNSIDTITNDISSITNRLEEAESEIISITNRLESAENTISNLPSTYVTKLNDITGEVELAEGDNVTITKDGNKLTFDTLADGLVKTIKSNDDSVDVVTSLDGTEVDLSITNAVADWHSYEQAGLINRTTGGSGVPQWSTGWQNSGGEEGDISGWGWFGGPGLEDVMRSETSAIAYASFDLDLPAGSLVTGVEVGYSIRWDPGPGQDTATGHVCFVVGGVTSDVYSIGCQGEYPKYPIYKTFAFGGDDKLAGVPVNAFSGATNIIVQYYATAEEEEDWPISIVFSLTNLACQVHYGEPQELVNKYGLDEQGRFVIVNKEGTVGESIRYPLEEIDELKAGGFGDYWQFELNLKAGHWTDFEIKASTNNFDSLCYYYKSWTTQDATRGDTNAYVWFTDDYSDDVRVWRKKDHDKSISQMLVSTNSVVETVIFQPSHECEIDWQDWMFDERLVWSFVRVDDVGFEQNASGTKQRWNPVTGRRGNLFKP